MQGTPFLGQEDLLEEEMAPFRKGRRSPSLGTLAVTLRAVSAAWVGLARVGLGGGRTL